MSEQENFADLEDDVSSDMMERSAARTYADCQQNHGVEYCLTRLEELALGRPCRYNEKYRESCSSPDQELCVACAESQPVCRHVHDASIRVIAAFLKSKRRGDENAWNVMVRFISENRTSADGLDESWVYIGALLDAAQAQWDSEAVSGQ